MGKEPPAARGVRDLNDANLEKIDTWSRLRAFTTKIISQLPDAQQALLKNTGISDAASLASTKAALLQWAQPEEDAPGAPVKAAKPSSRPPPAAAAPAGQDGGASSSNPRHPVPAAAATAAAAAGDQEQDAGDDEEPLVLDDLRASLQAHLAALEQRANAATLSTEMQALYDKLAYSNSTQVMQLVAAIQPMQQQLHSLQGKYRCQRNELHELTVAVGQMQLDLAGLNASQAEEEQQRKAAVGDLQSSIMAATVQREEELKQLQGAVKEQARQIASLQNQLRQQPQRAAAGATAGSQQQQQVEALAAKVEALEASRNELQQQLEELQRQPPAAPPPAAEATVVADLEARLQRQDQRIQQQDEVLAGVAARRTADRWQLEGQQRQPRRNWVRITDLVEVPAGQRRSARQSFRPVVLPEATMRAATRTLMVDRLGFTAATADYILSTAGFELVQPRAGAAHASVIVKFSEARHRSQLW